MGDDWYRSAEWGPIAIQEFEERLQRSRSYSRPQYLKIKAFVLVQAGHIEAGKSLFERVVDEYPDSFHTGAALEGLGDLLWAQGEMHRAEQAYRRLLREFPDLNGTTGEARLALGEVLAELYGGDAVEEARALLRESEKEIRSNATLFRALLLSARVAEAAGDSALQVSEASRALELLDAGPQLPHKPTIGVPKPTGAQLADLRRLACQ